MTILSMLESTPTARLSLRSESGRNLTEYTWDSPVRCALFQQPVFVRSDEWISSECCGMIVGQEVTAAMKLQDLYYGNVIPCQHDVRKDSDYAKRSLELLEMCDTLEKRLSADDKKLLNDITDMQGMLSETMAAESYIQGFRDCAELMINVMFGSSENLK